MGEIIRVMGKFKDVLINSYLESDWDKIKKDPDVVDLPILVNKPKNADVEMNYVLKTKVGWYKTIRKNKDSNPEQVYIGIYETWQIRSIIQP